MKKYVIICIATLTFLACIKRDKRKVVDDVKSNSEVKENIKTIDIADLPILIDSTNFMIHPIGQYTINKNRSEYSNYKGYRSSNQTIANYNGDRLTGSMSNVKFEQIDSNQLITLTNKTISINSITFLRDIFMTNKKGYFIYQLIDKDTNGDSKLDINDLRSLYICNLNGTGFRKLSPNPQDLISWKAITKANKLYFKTIEDTDYNGEFDKKDKMHYFYLNLNDINSKVTEYFPI